ncbi:MAG: hypothetical protein AAF447_27015 [Myxococcota bacterium]
MRRIALAAALLSLAGCEDARTVDPATEALAVRVQFQRAGDNLLLTSAIDQLTVFLDIPPTVSARWPELARTEVEPGLSYQTAPGGLSLEVTMNADYILRNQEVLTANVSVEVFLFPDGQTDMDGIGSVDLTVRAFQDDPAGGLVLLGESQTTQLPYPIRSAGSGTNSRVLQIPCADGRRAECTRG